MNVPQQTKRRNSEWLPALLIPSTVPYSRKTFWLSCRGWKYHCNFWINTGFVWWRWWILTCRSLTQYLEQNHPNSLLLNICPFSMQSCSAYSVYSQVMEWKDPNHQAESSLSTSKIHFSGRQAPLDQAWLTASFFPGWEALHLHFKQHRATRSLFCLLQHGSMRHFEYLLFSPLKIVPGHAADEGLRAQGSFQQWPSEDVRLIYALCHPLGLTRAPPQLPSLSSPLISACCYAKGANLRTDSSEKKAIKKKKAPYFRNLNNKPCDQNNS